MSVSMLRSSLSFLFWLTIVLALGIGGLLAYIYSGVYDVSAIKQHTPLTYWVLSTARRQSIKAHTTGESPLDLADADVRARGLLLFDRHCRQCHGAPGVAPDAIGLGMNPSPPNFAQMGRDLPASEIYWAVSNGIKLTGMPAWEFRLNESERWAIVAFLKSSPTLAPAEYKDRRTRLLSTTLNETTPHSPDAFWKPEDATRRGQVAVQQYACPTCHVIPGIRGPDAQVGPPLEGIATRIYLAGVLLNTPANMIEWVRNPQAIKPLSAMPNLGVTERDARDIAAYLYTLR
ncbi:c-type cytochrome [Microvirga sp. TS319]|uniref:c-type cytochrome n=1 Tax=Microvirga sp. TS319 TaxID=3241165 RepID=UPI00351A59CA